MWKDARRQPHEIFLLLLAIVSGLVGLTGGDPANGFAGAFPAWLQVCWFGGLVLGSSVALCGILINGIRGLFVERAGLIVLSALCFSVALGTVCDVRSDVGWVAFGTVLAFGLINLLRVAQIKTQAEQRAAFDLQREMS